MSAKQAAQSVNYGNVGTDTITFNLEGLNLRLDGEAITIDVPTIWLPISDIGEKLHRETDLTAVEVERVINAMFEEMRSITLTKLFMKRIQY